MRPPACACGGGAAAAVSTCLLMPSEPPNPAGTKVSTYLHHRGARVKWGGAHFGGCIVPGLVLHLARTFSQQNRKVRPRRRRAGACGPPKLFPRAPRPSGVRTRIAPRGGERCFRGRKSPAPFFPTG